MKMTAKMLAAKLGLDYVGAKAFITVGEMMGAIKVAGSVHTSETGKGKPSVLYDIPDSFTVNFSELEQLIAARKQVAVEVAVAPAAEHSVDVAAVPVAEVVPVVEVAVAPIAESVDVASVPVAEVVPIVETTIAQVVPVAEELPAEAIADDVPVAEAA